MTEKNDQLSELVQILARLRAPDGCPWDREQTHDTLRRYLVEEAGELLDAIEERDDAAMVDELGDVLLQIVFHSQIAAEEGRFCIDDVIRSECLKMIRRHPHVFAKAQAENPEAVVDQWDEIKRAEKGESAVSMSAVDGVPRHLPALHRAQKIQHKAAKAGFEWRDCGGFLDKIEEEFGEVVAALEAQDRDNLAEEIGDLLFAVVNLARHSGFQAEELLQTAVRKFDRRFRALENSLPEDANMANMSAAELLRHWDRTS